MKEMEENKFRLSVLFTVVTAAVIVLVILVLYHQPFLTMDSIGASQIEGLDSRTILIETLLLTLISLIGALIVIFKMKHSI